MQIHGTHVGAPIALSVNVKRLFLAFEVLCGWFQQDCLFSPFTEIQFSHLFTFSISRVGLPLPPIFSLHDLSKPYHLSKLLSRVTISWKPSCLHQPSVVCLLPEMQQFTVSAL